MRIGSSEIFVIPLYSCLSNEDQQVYIVYAPIDDETFLVSENDLSTITQYIEKAIVPQDDDLKELVDSLTKSYTNLSTPNISSCTRLSLLPNFVCNFSCSYCYSAKGRMNKEIDQRKVKIMLDYFIDENRIAPQHLSLFISGGGEPLISWDSVCETIEYAKKRASDKGFTIHISIITNGSLLTENMVKLLKMYDCTVCVSFEVLPELQDIQRKHFDRVDQNIKLLGAAGVRTLLNSTITPLSVNKMVDMMKAVITNYPFVEQYTMEPVTSTDVFHNSEHMAQFYDSFYHNYLKSKKIADKHAFKLRFAMEDALSSTVVRHCPGKLCLTPDAKITACHLASSPKEERYSKCVYGEVDESKVIINHARFNEIYNVNVLSYKRCNDCFAKWNCGGECMARNDTYPQEYMAEVCNFNRRFIKHLLIERVEKSVYEQTGMNLYEYAKQN